MPECGCTEMNLIKNGNGYFSDVEKYCHFVDGAWKCIDKIEN